MAQSANIRIPPTLRGVEKQGRRSPDGDRPNMRIVLLGKSVSENSGVGNFLLERAAFYSEASPNVVERVGGRLKDRHMMVINCPQLLQTNISDHQITRIVRECVNLSDPGPHVFILVLQHNDFTEDDRYRVKTILKEFSEEAIQHTIVLTTDEETPVTVNKSIQQLNTECRGNFKLANKTEELHSIVFQRLEEILKANHGEFLHFSDDGKHRDTYTKTKETKGNTSAQRKQKLNLVLCGSDESLKDSISNHIREKNRVSLVKLPALNQLSEEEVMRQTLRCVSLCDPGVHVFLLIIPYGPLNNEDKAEMEKIHGIFSSSINKHIMILLIQDKNVISSISSLETFIQTFGGQRFVLDNGLQVPALLQDVENMVKENEGSFYTTFMYLQAQVELERNKHKAEIERLEQALMKTQPTAAGVARDDDLRIILLGKTGVGKSATGNTILRRRAFKSLFDSSSVTRECQKETTEFNRRRITVIDTPGLFDTGVDNVETRKEIVKCVSMAAPGPHVFLLVMQLGRFTEEEKNAVKLIQETFGDKSRMYTMVLFTRGDDLEGRTIEDFIERNGSLKNITQQFGKRYHVFNNKNSEDETQVSELLGKIDCLVSANGGSFYTNEMFQLVEKNIQEEQERILKEKEEEIKRKEEELKTKYQAEIEEMKKENKREREEMQNELRKREEDFKKREEEIKKETDANLRKELHRKLEEKQKQFEEENKRKEKALGEQQQNFIKYLEEKHEKEKQNLQEKIQCETREQAEREYREKLDTAVARALEEAEESLPYRSRRARDWGFVPVVGGAAGGLYGTAEDLVYWISSKPFQ